MICDDCKKNESTVHFTQIINNQKTVLNLCKTCAEKRGFTEPLVENVPGFGVESLVSKIAMEFEEERNALSCPHCQMRYQDFKRTGKLGCGECYQVFGERIDGLLRKIHGSDFHAGKSPLGKITGDAGPRRLETLRQEIKQAILKEDFEVAARLRDEIKTLEKRKARD